jgi:FKBP-type peptidyl-prolyl cis-trans isomerase 2
MSQHGQRLFLEYTVWLQDGTQVDSNVGEEPLALTLGSQQIFPALEAVLVGLNPGESTQVVLQAEEAYGPILKEAFREVDLSTLPASFRYAGAILGVQDPSGGVYPIRVHRIEGEKAVLDFNHPLAGQSLKFAVKVVRIE